MTKLKQISFTGREISLLIYALRTSAFEKEYDELQKRAKRLRHKISKMIEE